MKQIAYLKPDSEHLNVRDKPNGKVIGSISTGIMVQLTGQEKDTATVKWVEGFYEGNGKVVRGWMAKKWLDIKPDPVFYNPPQFNPPPLDYAPGNDPLNAPLSEIPIIVDPEPKFRNGLDAFLSIAAAMVVVAVVWLVWSLF